MISLNNILFLTFLGAVFAVCLENTTDTGGNADTWDCLFERIRDEL
jgi:hypothetical protein